MNDRGNEGAEGIVNISTPHSLNCDSHATAVPYCGNVINTCTWERDTKKCHAVVHNILKRVRCPRDGEILEYAQRE